MQILLELAEIWVGDVPVPFFSVDLFFLSAQSACLSFLIIQVFATFEQRLLLLSLGFAVFQALLITTKFILSMESKAFGGLSICVLFLIALLSCQSVPTLVGRVFLLLLLPSGLLIRNLSVHPLDLTTRSNRACVRELPVQFFIVSAVIWPLLYMAPPPMMILLWPAMLIVLLWPMLPDDEV